MSDLELQARLDTLFAETQVFADAAEFAMRTQRLLRHRRRLRLLILTLMGATAGSLSVYLLIAAGVPVDLAKVGDAALRATGRFGFYWTAIAAMLVLSVYQVTSEAPHNGDARLL